MTKHEKTAHSPPLKTIPSTTIENTEQDATIIGPELFLDILIYVFYKIFRQFWCLFTVNNDNDNLGV